ncbi:bacteriohemerythrin [Mesoterricola silvestris]|uniref:Bacteriohemerythrin n=1 Tax=Mesoterricola silvestris TaxID=2927979 RepID=A0AA48GL28_9BACT|nr:bacteriohemerythrin [Mesoterricola silvestris]BDU71425.1 bacteriohemerythrin [Mesoterricola silvestris]
MAAIIWDRHLATGCDELDEQHRTLIDTFNRLCALAGRGDWNHDEIEGSLIFLRDYTLVHLETEQELMARHGYPLEAEHRRLHSDLVQDLEAIVDGFHRGTKDLTPVTLEYLDQWLQRHIRNEDFRLAEFLRHAEARTRG